MSRSNEWNSSQKDSLDYLTNIESKIWIFLFIAFFTLYFVLKFGERKFKIENKTSFWNTIRLFVNQCK